MDILEQPSKQKVALLQAKSLSSWGNPIGPKQWSKMYRNMVRYCFYFHLAWIGARNFIGQVYFLMISCRYSTNLALIVYTIYLKLDTIFKHMLIKLFVVISSIYQSCTLFILSFEVGPQWIMILDMICCWFTQNSRYWSMKNIIILHIFSMHIRLRGVCAYEIPST